MLDKISFTIDGDKVYCSSLQIAEYFNKEHRNVCASIDKLIEMDGELDLLTFKRMSYQDSYDRNQRGFLMTRDGFMFLAMGFTGESAYRIKKHIIAEYNKMESQLQQARELITQPVKVLTPMQESVEVIKAKLEVYKLFYVPLHIAQIESVKVAKQLTGIDHSDVLKLAPAQDNIKSEEKMLEPKELETQLGIGKSGQKINKILLVFGYQTNTNGTWQPTDKAIGKYSEHAWVSGSKSGYNYKWNLDFAKGLVNQLIANYGNVDTALKELIN